MWDSIRTQSSQACEGKMGTNKRLNTNENCVNFSLNFNNKLNGKLNDESQKNCRKYLLSFSICPQWHCFSNRIKQHSVRQLSIRFAIQLINTHKHSSSLLFPFLSSSLPCIVSLALCP